MKTQTGEEKPDKQTGGISGSLRKTCRLKHSVQNRRK
ncbi:hypothetical protein BACCAP_04459 [Pseudoflavonifractor capillosus ATCC 29799]|uniref:Uncharacterized protein n=1 Tax=Pseudoflavonifractor capillosus ATCC 29799 TaxID=411467 RepID=A6P1T7_9FIRM|nr:hypothetical protein BACCAP_04459 [Pseudoflavonifractor capillosus ATCC 29799]